jgi:hypothetical protein
MDLRASRCTREHADDGHSHMRRDLRAKLLEHWPCDLLVVKHPEFISGLPVTHQAKCRPIDACDSIDQARHSWPKAV